MPEPMNESQNPFAPPQHKDAADPAAPQVLERLLEASFMLFSGAVLGVLLGERLWRWSFPQGVRGAMSGAFLFFCGWLVLVVMQSARRRDPQQSDEHLDET